MPLKIINDQYWRNHFSCPDERAKEGDRCNIVNTLHRRYLPVILSRLGYRGGKGVDIGCGAGTYVELLDGLGFDMIGVDYSFPMLKVGKERVINRDIKLISANVYELPLRDMSQDIIITMGLLPLLTDVPRALREMVRVIKPGGVLLCETRNKYSLFRFAQRMLYGDKYRTMDNQLFHFSPWNLARDLQYAGFTFIRFHGFYVFPGPAQWVSSLIYRCKLDLIGTSIFSITNCFSHSFWISAVRSDRETLSVDSRKGHV